MRFGELFIALALVGLLGCGISHRGSGGSPALVSQAGRDQALMRLIQGARRTIYLRTERFTLVPAGNEMAQAVQRGVVVNLELPLEAGRTVVDTNLPLLLMELGAGVAFRGDATENIRGAYLEVDGEAFLYSAVPVVISLPGACVSFVSGPIQRWGRG